MGTIVQEYGPIYGETVNGTVSGRPNGSYYVPADNTIQLTIEENLRYMKAYSSTLWLICNSSGISNSTMGAVAIAESQDLASYIDFQIFSDAEATNLIGSFKAVSGIFNYGQRGFSPGENEDLTSYANVYMRAQLINNSVPVATSDTIELEVYTP